MCYLQARVCNFLPNARKKRDEAAKMFARLTVEMRERLGDSILAIGDMHSSCSKQQWDVLRGVMITDSRELQRYVSMKQQR